MPLDSESMMVTPRECPSTKLLSSYVRGTLSDKEAETVAEHVETCVECEATVEKLEIEGDAILRAVRNLAPADSELASPECREALARAEAAGSVAFPESRDLEVPGDPALELPFRLGEYELLAKLGQGGMGAVYRARHIKLGKTVALKILTRDRVARPQAIARFEREMKAIGRLEHPNIVQALDAREIDGMHFLVMQCVEGKDVAQLADCCGPLGIADACEVIRQAAVGLQYAHERGLIHRDIKPSNLILTSAGQLKILDFGLALLGEDDGEGEGQNDATAIDDGGTLTGEGQAMGTADYVAPEQVTDGHQVDHRVDIYSLGCTLYRLLGGRPPFFGPSYRTSSAKMAAHAHDKPPSIREFRPDVPKDLAALLHRMLAKNPSERLEAADVAAKLEPYAQTANLSSLLRRKATDENGSSATLALSSGDGRRISWKRGLLPAALGGTALLLLGGIITIATDRGILEIETSDDDAKVTISRDGREVAICDPRTDKTISLWSGQYELTLADGVKELVLSADHFAIRRGEKVIVKVASVVPSKKISRDRRAAERVLTLGGRITLSASPSAPAQEFGKVEDLPQEPIHLRSVNAASCSLADADAKLLEGCSTVEEIDFGRTGVSDAGVLCLPLGSLRRLALCATKVGIASLQYLGGATRLEHLDLWGCGEVEDNAMVHVAGLHQLQDLCLDGTRVTDAGVATIASLPALRELHVCSMGITDAGILQLKASASLRSLYIGCNAQIDDISLDRIGTLTNLELLMICRTRVTDAGLKHLQRLSRLEHLDLNYNQITDAGLAHLGVLRKLQVLKVQGTSVSDVGVGAIRSALPGCRVEVDDTIHPQAGVSAKTHEAAKTPEGESGSSVSRVEETQTPGPSSQTPQDSVSAWPAVLEQDLAAIQGTWVAEYRDRSGRVVKQMLKRVYGTKERVTRWNGEGQVISDGENDFVLELDGSRRVFQTIKNGELGLRYGYRVDGNHFVELAANYTLTWTRIPATSKTVVEIGSSVHGEPAVNVTAWVNGAAQVNDLSLGSSRGHRLDVAYGDRVRLRVRWKEQEEETSFTVAHKPERVQIAVSANKLELVHSFPH